MYFSFTAATLKRMILCFCLQSFSVVFSVYIFIGAVVGKYYLIHFGTSVTTIIMMLEPVDNVAIKCMYPIISFMGYSWVRHFTGKSWVHIVVAGSLNVIEQYISYYATTMSIKRFLSEQEKDVKLYAMNLKVVLILFVLSVVISLIFSVPGSFIFHLLFESDLQDTLLLYSIGHQAGYFFGMYTYYVTIYSLRNFKTPLKWKRYMYSFIVLILTAIACSFRNYGLLLFPAVIVMFPLCAYIAIIFPLGLTWLHQILSIVIVFVLTQHHRGPFRSGDDPFLTIISMYFLFTLSSTLSIYLCIVTRQRLSALKKIHLLRDEIVFVTQQANHDLRQPISHILNVCESIQKRQHNESDIEDVVYSCEFVDELMNSWLTLLISLNSSDATTKTKTKLDIETLDDKKETVEMNVFFNKMCRYTERSLRRTENAKISFKSVMDNVNMHRFLQIRSVQHLNHIVINLLSNALKYTHQGEITFECMFNDSENELVIIIRDEGIGISTENQKKIFEQYYRVKDSGNLPGSLLNADSHGVGLYIVSTLLKQLNGSIDLHSVLGEGSEFIIHVPATVRVVKHDEFVRIQTVDEYIQSFSSLRVLIAEDNVYTSAIIKHMLQCCRSTKTLYDGNEAFQEIKDNSTEYDIILLDGHLPNLAGANIIDRLACLVKTDECFRVPPIVSISGIVLDYSSNWKPLVVVDCQKIFTRDKLLDRMQHALQLHRNEMKQLY